MNENESVLFLLIRHFRIRRMNRLIRKINMSTDRIERRKKLYDSMVDKYNKDYGTSLEKFNYVLKGESK